LPTPKQKSKVTIDASNGQIYFGDYINVGTYNLSIKYATV
jgi:flagellar basal body P-ring protein FlgI